MLIKAFLFFLYISNAKSTFEIYVMNEHGHIIYIINNFRTISTILKNKLNCSNRFTKVMIENILRLITMQEY